MWYLGRLDRVIRAVRRHPWRWLAGVVVVLVGMGVWVLWPASSAPSPRARPYLTYTACLLTDEQGISAAGTRPVWEGMQDASLRTHAKVEYLSVVGPQTTANALPFLAALAQGRCDQVFAVGPVPVAALTQDAARFPTVRFIAVGAGSPHGNVTVISASTPDDIRAAVSRAVVAGVAASPGQ